MVYAIGARELLEGPNPIVRPEQLVHDRHLIESGGLAPTQAEDGTATQTVLLPLLMGGRRLGVRGPLPRVGEHTEQVLGQLLGASRA